MPPQIQALLEQLKTNRMMQIAIGGGVLVVIILIVVGAVMMGGGEKKKEDPGEKPISTEQVKLMEKIPVGKAIEIQALLARSGVHVNKTEESGKANLDFDKETTKNQRDQAIITIVQSGLMDKNLGLEAFDSSDLMASREEKRIKLIRAQQGELARLIRKIDPVEDATVSISIPDPSIFKSEEKPITGSVQVTLQPGERLTRDKVRAIMNLMVGSIQGLTAENLAIADTNGNTYNSVLDASSTHQDKLEEQDQYMKQKVQAQLDRLVGPGHYVVSVSTELREAPKEMMVEAYDPAHSAVASKQRFSEKLNANGDPNPLGPVSSFLPKGMGPTSARNATTKGYTRDGVETAYQNSKTQTVESLVPGMIEDISIAITIDRDFYPTMNEDALRELLARAASPKVNPASVSIAKTDFRKPTPLPKAEPEVPKVDPFAWLPWALGAIGAVAVIVFVMMMLGQGSKKEAEKIEAAQRELEELRQYAAQQQAQFQAAQQQTAQILEAQRQQLEATMAQTAALPQQIAQTQQQLLAAQQQQQPVVAPPEPRRLPDTSQLRKTLMELKATVADDDVDPEEIQLPIKSWIESS